MQVGIISIGDVPQSILNFLNKRLRGIYSIEFRMEGAIEIPSEAFNPVRNQFRSSSLLRLCKKEAVMNGFDKILGVTDVDIYADKASFIFGQAELHGKAAIVSIYRLKNNGNDRKDTDLVLSRVLKEAVHEMGHTLGLKHCNLRRCVMYFSKNIDDTDTKSYLFCEDCKYMLDGYVKDIPAIR